MFKVLLTKKRGYLQRYGLLIITLIVFIFTFLVTKNVRLYGDDFFYRRFTSKDFAYFLSKHKEHYFLANGRVIVHLLATYFLGLPTLYWAVLNSCFLAGCTYFGAKASGNTYSGLIFALGIAFLHPNMTRQSVYWLTGSFNYVYPIFLLLIYWYCLKRSLNYDSIKWYVPVLAFFSAASVEQTGVMTFGLTLIVLIENVYIQKKKLEKMYVLTLIMATVGMLSVIVSPAVFYRASIQQAPVDGFFSLIKYNIKTISTTFLFSDMMKPYHIFVLTAAIGTIIKYGKDQGLTKKWLNAILVIFGANTVIGWLWQMRSNVSIRLVPNNLFIYFALLGLGYLILVGVAGYLFYKNENYNPVPLIALILCFGSQFMMVVSPVFGPRNLVCAVFMLILYAAILIPKLHTVGAVAVCGAVFCYLYQLPWFLPIPISAFVIMLFKRKELSKIGCIVSFITLAFIALNNLVPTIKGYAENAIVYDQNIQIAKDFKSQNRIDYVHQRKLPKETYGWAMPYHNTYYVPYYRMYLKLDKETEIQWQ